MVPTLSDGLTVSSSTTVESPAVSLIPKILMEVFSESKVSFLLQHCQGDCTIDLLLVPMLPSI